MSQQIATPRKTRDIILDNIKRECKASGINVTVLAQKMGVNRTSFYKLTERTQLNKFIYISYCIGCKVSDLMTEI